MKKVLFLLVAVVAFSLIFGFSFVKAQNEENQKKEAEVKEVEVKRVEKEAEVKYKPPKFETRVPKLSEKQIGPFKELDDFVRENIAEHPSASFFILNPSGNVVQQGIVDQYQNNVLTVNSQGFKMDWIVATDTMVIASSRLPLLAQATPQPVSISDIPTGTRVKVFGNWDGNKLNAKKVVVLEKRVKAEIENLIQRLKETLQKLGINIDLTPLIQQLQR